MPLKLDIGCGGRGTRWPSFIGLDILPPPAKPHGDREYVQRDFIRDELPWGADSADEILALHVIEHMPRDWARALIHRAMAILKPDCALTLTTPDLRLIAQAYLDHDAQIFEKTVHGKPQWPGTSYADKFNWICHEYGHKWLYDIESLTLLVAETGWPDFDILDDTDRYVGKDHECGVRVWKRGEQKSVAPPNESLRLERRIETWRGREERGLKNP